MSSQPWILLIVACIKSSLNRLVCVHDGVVGARLPLLQCSIYSTMKQTVNAIIMVSDMSVYILGNCMSLLELRFRIPKLDFLNLVTLLTRIGENPES